MLIASTALPGCVPRVFRGMPTGWRGRQRRLCCGLLCMPAVSPGRKTLEERARWTPATITAWRFGRVRNAAYGNGPLLVRWLAQDLVATWPAPAHGLLSLLGDGSHADPRRRKHPVGQKGRLRTPHPWFFGLRCVWWMAAGDGYRVPVGLRLMRPKRHAASRREHALLRAMVGACVPPSWAKRVMGGGEAADGSTAHRRMVQDRDTAASARRWGFVCAIARTSKSGEDQALTPLVTHVPHTDDQGTRVPSEGSKGRTTLWT
jgi:hypothetical protein